MSETREPQPADEGVAGAQNEFSKHPSDTESDWAAVSQAMIEFDERVMSDWKDDLANLLIFAGLFSAVVTGFVVESFGWLQPDTSPDVSIQLLSQISMQLASLSVSPGFINSTVPSLTVHQLNPPANPASSSVRINILWFLSLALSIIASLLAIMVQQWLREYRLPGFLSVRDRVRLRQLRYEALEDWQVPAIVAILPMLLQAALLLFLAGLCYLLFTLDRTVAVAFVAFVGVALTVYFTLVVLPILFRRAPYRNPLSHAILSTFKMSTWAIYLLFLSALILISAGICKITQLLGWLCDMSLSQIEGACVQVISVLIPILSTNIVHLRTLGIHSIWTSRDLEELSNESEVQRLDQVALLAAQSVIPKSQASSLSRCLHDLPPERRLACVVGWVAETLHCDVETFNIGPGGGRLAFHCVFSVPAICAMLNSTFAARFKDCLLEVLPTRLSKETKGLHLAYIILVLLYKLARSGATVDAKYREAFARHLIAMVAAQTPEDFCDRWSRLPSLCLLDLIQDHSYSFDEPDLHILLDHVLRIHDTIPSAGTISIDLPESIIVLHSVPLAAISSQPIVLTHNPELRQKYQEVLVKLDAFLRADNRLINRYALDDPANMGDGVPSELLPALVIICKSLATLVEAGALPLPVLKEDADSAELTAVSFLDNAIKVLDGVYHADNAVDHLRRARGMLDVVSVKAELPQNSSPTADTSGTDTVHDA